MSLSLDLRALSLDERAVLQPLQVRLRPGEWVAVVGPNGAGKSSLLRVLAGLLPAAATLRLDERDWASHARGQRAQALAWLGPAPGDEAADALRVHETVMLGRLPHQGWMGLPSANDQAQVKAALQAVQAWDWRDRRLAHLSAGERQRVLLARALAVQARYLLLDEPLSHLDGPHQADALALLRAQAQRGTAVCTVLHELHLALRADRLWVLAEGRLLFDGPTSVAAARDALQQAFGHRLRFLRDVEGRWLALPA